ncbi:GNAT family N-acetyltransferase [Spirosoma aerolatum]|uniref:GNAT family N-acetyltransferase n=1 Tax=Spirosoma aerolatum TaxID=1211326 RepID=UPI0009ABF607|nr:GNAT family N-acetyltransferase [Spirosoma aerolatum]
MVQLHTQRLLLRPWQSADAELFAAMNADSAVMEHFPACLTRAESDAMIERISNHMTTKGWGLWALEAPTLAPFIGFCGLWTVSFDAPFTPAVEIGWRLARPFWDNGYAFEAAQAALAFGLDTLGLPEIVSFTIPANVRSWRLMERLGMTHNPIDDFDHPRLPEGHPMRRHVLYRKQRANL